MIDMRKLVARCFCGLFASSCISVGQAADVPAAVEKTASCMLEVLKATPGVIGPVVGTTTSEGWTHPFLEYRADEALSRESPIRFDVRKGHGGYEFWAVKSGFGAPELHVTEAVVQKWNVHCHAYANVYFP